MTPSTTPSVQARRAAILREALMADSIMLAHSRLVTGRSTLEYPFLFAEVRRICSEQEARIATAEADLAKLEGQA